MLVTRISKEIINAHKIKTVPNYEDRLASFGTPAQNRTGGFGLERLAGNPPHGSVGNADGLATSKLAHDNTIANNGENVNAPKVEAPLAPQVTKTPTTPTFAKILAQDMPPKVAGELPIVGNNLSFPTTLRAREIAVL